MTDPVDAREVRPSRSYWTHLTECRTEGHEPGEWLPDVSSIKEMVSGRVQYCERCGARLHWDKFRRNPEASYVFVDKPWYPERLSCYKTDEPPVDCALCGEQGQALSLHASLHITEHDYRSPHRAERDTDDYYLEVCADCWARLADDLDLDAKAAGNEHGTPAESTAKS